jgi:hypothetical protein
VNTIITIVAEFTGFEMDLEGESGAIAPIGPNRRLSIREMEEF